MSSFLKIAIPSEWQIKKLKDCVNINPENLNLNEINEDYINYIDIASIDNSTFQIKNVNKIPIPDIPSRARRVIKENDVIVSTVRPYLKAFSKVYKEHENFICSTGFAVLRAKEGLNNEYLFQWILNQKFVNYMISQMVGSSYPAVNKSDVETAPIILPPLNEQIRIGSILSNIDIIIIKIQKTIDNLQLLKKGLMQRLFTEGIGHTEFKRIKFIGKMPKIWNISILSKITNQINDGTHWTPEYIESGVPFLRIGDIKERKINWDSVKKISRKKHQELINRCKPDYGDVLLSKNGTVGITMVVDWDIEFSLYVSICLIKPKHDILNNKYLAYFLTSAGMKQINYRSKTGTVKNLHLEEIRELLIPLPSISEQNQIAEILEEVDKKIEAEKNILIKYKKIKKGLMQDLLTGKKRVKKVMI